MKVKDIKRFLSKVNEGNEDECWEWQAYKNEQGYGRFGINRKIERAHRISYIIFNNIKIENIKGFVIMHMCDNPSCINPNHLRMGTQGENVKDCINKKRFCNFTSTKKLSIEDIKEIKKELLDKNKTHRKIAEKYNVSRAHVSNIKLGKRWQHITI